MREVPGYRYEACRHCGLRWNISKGQFVPKSGYTCPHCQDKLRRGIRGFEVRAERREGSRKE